MSKSRDQSLYDAMFQRSLDLGYITYSYKPLNEVAYPFVEFDETMTQFNLNKTDLKGTVTLDINIYGLMEKRKQVSDMARELFNAAFDIKTSDGFNWVLNTQASNIRMVNDNTTNTALKRAILELEFRLI